MFFPPKELSSFDRNIALEHAEPMNSEKPLIQQYAKLIGAAKNQGGKAITKESSIETRKQVKAGSIQMPLAKKSQDDCDDETKETAAKIPKRSSLEEFSARVARYYRRHYANVPSMGESHKHVKDVWLPLQMENRNENNLAACYIDHVDLLNRLKSAQGADVAIIKGDPGMGKTTIAKKIAYDWAISYSCTESHPFSLVLAVPLRSAGKFSRFEHLAIGYFLSVIDVEDLDANELLGELHQLQSHLLIILDGLDEYEYNSFGDNPFRIIFAPKFQHYSVCTDILPVTAFKLLITSRPYALEKLSKEMRILMFVILPLDVHHVGDFAKLYCQTTSGVSKVAEYLKSNTQLIIQVPLILSFICYLADSVPEIPSNMTNLYDSFIRQMLRRESRQEKKLEESVDMQNWKDSHVVKSTGQLAFWGSIVHKYEFTSESLEKCRVSNDSFVCGFLLHKFNFNEETLAAEFPHRSIQEFFAALHCYQLMLSGRKDVLKKVNKMMLTGRDSQIGRFLFGTCSMDGRFPQMISWLNPSLSGSDFQPPPAAAINRFGASLIDCSPDDNRILGQKLYDSTDALGLMIVNLWHMYRPVNPRFRFDNLSTEFKAALQFNTLTRDYDWFLAKHGKSIKLAVIRSGLEELLEGNFEKVDFLIWGYTNAFLSANDWKARFDQIKVLPPVSTLIMETGISGVFIQFTSVTVCVRYGQGVYLNLTNLRFDYATKYRDELLDTVERETYRELTVDEKNEAGQDEDMTFRLLNVTVNDSMCQSALIFSLMRLSLLESNAWVSQPVGGTLQVNSNTPQFGKTDFADLPIVHCGATAVLE